jgi:hypothetical protein
VLAKGTLVLSVGISGLTAHRKVYIEDLPLIEHSSCAVEKGHLLASLRVETVVWHTLENLKALATAN